VTVSVLHSASVAVSEATMSVQLTAEQRELVDTVRDFCAKEFGTRGQRIALTDGGANLHNRDLTTTMGSLGWLGLSIPDRYSGPRLDV
jgi:isovaleryl-CoA dehydrogenase